MEKINRMLQIFKSKHNDGESPQWLLLIITLIIAAMAMVAYFPIAVLKSIMYTWGEPEFFFTVLFSYLVSFFLWMYINWVE
jgi:hypothetical protein